MKVDDVRGKTDDELKDALASLRKEAFNLRFQRASGQLENTSRVRGIRRDIARVKTILTERRKGIAAPAKAAAAKSKAKPKKAKKA